MSVTTSHALPLVAAGNYLRDVYGYRYSSLEMQGGTVLHDIIVDGLLDHWLFGPNAVSMTTLAGTGIVLSVTDGSGLIHFADDRSLAYRQSQAMLKATSYGALFLLTAIFVVGFLALIPMVQMGRVAWHWRKARGVLARMKGQGGRDRVSAPMGAVA